jgi:putative addiction module component (TIGR02574 family)
MAPKDYSTLPSPFRRKIVSSSHLELASKLLESVEDAPSEERSAAWLAECDARIAAAESGAEPPVPWNEAHGRLRARLGQQ